MRLGATRYGYFYQDLIAAIALVDLVLGTAETITVDTKGLTQIDSTMSTSLTSTRLGPACRSSTPPLTANSQRRPLSRRQKPEAQ